MSHNIRNNDDMIINFGKGNMIQYVRFLVYFKMYTLYLEKKMAKDYF